MSLTVSHDSATTGDLSSRRVGPPPAPGYTGMVIKQGGSLGHYCQIGDGDRHHARRRPHQRPGARGCRARRAPWVTTLELDAIAADVIRTHGGKPAFLGYPNRSFPDFPYPATINASIDGELVPRHPR